ncbi:MULTISPECIES: fumarylacetoacetate hydrolase family protein [unclassified Burkholderia]|uniref:fumarylacetoacetate hydrolase family protein n=1 Tax=unclassified Burkholderia TaxID=2613784 RepID=UPI002AB1E606|nr:MULTISPECIES: fumarylacetoacetate hydrolase family protein [unclassified Burkholderia]
MKICRYDFNRVGAVVGDGVYDITDLFDRNLSWPVPQGDIVIAQLKGVVERGIDLRGRSRRSLDSVRLESPVANPGKIVGAPVNYHAHIEEANADNEINTGKTYTTLEAYGGFLKANSSLIGPADEVQLAFSDRRTDHEVELAVVIGKTARYVKANSALDYVAGYAIGLDMSIRGQETPCYRKSADTYSVLGPWLVLPDEIPDPDSLEMSLRVNGELRQQANTRLLIVGVRRLIEYTSALYTLNPGDIIMTGTPAGVGPVVAGDVMDAEIEKIGSLRIRVATRHGND